MGNEEFNPGGNLGIHGHPIEGKLEMLNDRYGNKPIE